MPAETYTKTTTTYTPKPARATGRTPGPRLQVVRESNKDPELTLSVPPAPGTRCTWQAMEIPDFEALRQLIEVASEALAAEEGAKTDG